MADLSVRIGNVLLKNPIMPASGTWGYGPEDPGLFDMAELGAVLTKSVMLRPQRGNQPQRLAETAAGMLNSIGIPSDGLEHWLAHYWPYVKAADTVRIVSLGGTEVEEFIEATSRLITVPGIDAIELNMSCPNLTEPRMIAEDEKQLAAVVEGTTKLAKPAGIPIIAKLSPNVSDIAAMAEVAEEAGADGVTVANALTGMAIDLPSGRPFLGHYTGGLTGPAIKPIILRMVWQVSQKVRIPVIASGGVANERDALEYIAAGATAIQVGTANFYEPDIMPRIVAGLKAYLEEHGVSSVEHFRGRAWPNGRGPGERKGGYESAASL